MPTNELKVLNGALNLLGEPRAQDLVTATMRPKARSVYGLINDAREAVLERHGWVDALEYVTLQPDTGDAGWKYAKLFVLPANAVGVWEVNGCTDWQKGTMTDADGRTRHTIRANGVDELPISFIRNAPCDALSQTLGFAVSARLAAMTAFDVTEDAGRADKLAERAETEFMKALAVDGRGEGGGEPEICDTMHSIRRSAM